MDHLKLINEETEYYRNYLNLYAQRLYITNIDKNKDLTIIRTDKYVVQIFKNSSAIYNNPGMEHKNFYLLLAVDYKLNMSQSDNFEYLDKKIENFLSINKLYQ